jgi:hypothetical protein
VDPTRPVDRDQGCRAVPIRVPLVGDLGDARERERVIRAKEREERRRAGGAAIDRDEHEAPALVLVVGDVAEVVVALQGG